MNNDIKKAAESNGKITFNMPTIESLGQLESMQPDFSLTMRYKTAEDWGLLKNKPVRAYFMGLKDIPNEQGEPVQCGVFVTPNEIFLSAQTIIIEAVARLDSNTPVVITYRGKKSNKNTEGQTMIFDIETLK